MSASGAKLCQAAPANACGAALSSNKADDHVGGAAVVVVGTSMAEPSCGPVRKLAKFLKRQGRTYMVRLRQLRPGLGAACWQRMCARRNALA